MARVFRTFLPVVLAFSVAGSAFASQKDPLVYVTESGKKYHMKNCRLKHGSSGIKLSEAKKKGYSACAVCKPPK